MPSGPDDGWGFLAHLYHPVRMTDGGFDPCVPVRKAKKKFTRVTVHGRVEETDTQVSTWILLGNTLLNLDLSVVSTLTQPGPVRRIGSWRNVHTTPSRTLTPPHHLSPSLTA